MSAMPPANTECIESLRTRRSGSLSPFFAAWIIRLAIISHQISLNGRFQFVAGCVVCIAQRLRQIKGEDVLPAYERNDGCPHHTLLQHPKKNNFANAAGNKFFGTVAYNRCARQI